jgi:hypothetical protein
VYSFRRAKQRHLTSEIDHPLFTRHTQAKEQEQEERRKKREEEQPETEQQKMPTKNAGEYNRQDA